MTVRDGVSAHGREQWSLELPIRTPRTTLRLHRETDVDDLLVFHSDPLVTKHLPWPVRGRDEVIATLNDKIAQRHLDADDCWLSLAIERNGDGRVIGEALLHRLSDQAGEAEVGYVLAGDVHRQGFGTEVVRTLVEVTWSHLPVVTLFANVVPENVASLRLLAALGFEVGREIVVPSGAVLCQLRLGRPEPRV